MIQEMDLQIGRVLEALRANNLAENTIVIFTSDNGGERFADTWPFTGRKTELLEGGLRIPAVIRWPGHILRGSVSEQVMISMDWLPTLLAAADTAPDPAYPSDGMNLMPWLTQSATPVPRNCTGDTNTPISRQRATAIGNTSRSSTTPSSSMWCRIRWNAPTSRNGVATSTTGWSRSGTNGTRLCCRSTRRALRAASPGPNSPTISVSSRVHNQPRTRRPPPRRLAHPPD